MEKQKIQFGKYVELAYEIFIVTDRGDASVFKFSPDKPDGFVFGMDEGMIAGFAVNINGLAQGDTFDFTVEPDEAFGDYQDDMVVELPRDAFEVDGKFDDERVKLGARIPMRTEDGYILEGVVTAMTDDTVPIDFNHELAGETVHYVGQVLLVRDATPDELAPKHDHCGCGHDHCGHDHGDHCGHDHDHDHCGHDHCGCGHDHHGRHE